jgi:ADP-ribose pyrophosphatase
MARAEHPAWQVLSRERILDASPWLQVWREVVRVPDGRIVEDYHVVEVPDFAVVVALTDAGLAVVERHYRHGVRKVVLGLPAGKIEPGEEPLVAARRELREETGYGGGTWRSLGSFALSDSRVPGRAHLFLARGVERVAEPGGDDLEQTEVLLLEPGQLERAIEEGQVADVVAVAALLRAGLTTEPRKGPPFDSAL